MTLTVDTDTYATLDEYRDYAAAFGWTLAGSDALDEVNLRLGRRALDLGYIWRGDKSADDQPLAFPRDDEATPQAVKDAQCELAYLVQNGADPLATLAGGAVKREKVDVVETEYDRPRERAAYPAVDALVAGLHYGKPGQAGTLPVVRA